MLAVSEWKIVATIFLKSLVRCFSFLFPFSSSNLAILSYRSDHRRRSPKTIGNEKILHSQSHEVTNGMCVLALSAIKQG